MGVEIEQADSGLVRPPKINVASKFDRQVDRRSFGERYDQFEKVRNLPRNNICLNVLAIRQTKSIYCTRNCSSTTRMGPQSKWWVRSTTQKLGAAEVCWTSQSWRRPCTSQSNSLAIAQLWIWGRLKCSSTSRGGTSTAGKAKTCRTCLNNQLKQSLWLLH